MSDDFPERGRIDYIGGRIEVDMSPENLFFHVPIFYWRAGIAEYWLVDVRGERLLFVIHARGADGYEPAPVDGEGFQLSAVFDRRFRLERRRDARGRWVFDLQSRPCQR